MAIFKNNPNRMWLIKRDTSLTDKPCCMMKLYTKHQVMLKKHPNKKE